MLVLPLQMLVLPFIAEASIDVEKIIQIESGGNHLAYNSKSGARGLFQITPICLKHYNIVNNTHITKADLFDPKINRQVGEWYFKWLEKHCKTDREVLISYNYGYSHRKDKVLPKETSDYIKKYYELLTGYPQVINS